MEKRKARGSTADEAALTKSAAWAWLEHRSASAADPPTPEFDVSRTKFTPKPSRYKVEAMRGVPETSKSSTQINVCPKSSATPSRGNISYSLLDIYEIERISLQLDYYMKSSHANHLGSNHGGRRAATSKPGLKKKVPKGFWLLGPNAVVCGSSVDEVMDRSRGRRRPENGRVEVVEVTSCRPRQGIRA